jgi:glucosyl-3-phosphoglycerate synthase
MDFDSMESRLRSLSQKYPSGVIIPALENDLNNPMLPKIIDGLNECTYIKKVFIALSAANDNDYEKAMKLSNDLEVPSEIIWCNKPEANAILEELRKKGLDVTEARGKGKDLWIAIGIASLELYALAIHDVDIVSYSGMLPTKLLYAIVEPRLDFSFSKGYYARVNFENRKIYGRVYRLFINPLLDALQKKLVIVPL